MVTSNGAASPTDDLMAEAVGLDPAEEKAIRDGFERIGTAWLKVVATGKGKWMVICKPTAAGQPVFAGEMNLAAPKTMKMTVVTIVERLGPEAEAGKADNEQRLMRAVVESTEKVGRRAEAETEAEADTSGPADAADAADAVDNRPVIAISPDEHKNVDEAIAALAADPLLFQRNDALVTIVAECQPKPKKHEPVRPPGALRIVPLPAPQIRRLMSVHARWVTAIPQLKGADKIVPARPPAAVVEMVATMGRWPGIRPITGVIEAPTLRADGSLVATPGYDDETGLWFAPSAEFPPIPNEPTLADAQAARDELYGLIMDFPFAGPEHTSAWLAAALTPLVRSAIDGSCPLFLVDANTAGSGKTKLCDLIAILATGRAMPRVAYPDAPEEMAKVVLSIALAGDRLVLFDNVASGGTIGSPALDQALTSRTVKGRVLGKSEITPELPFDAAVFATGNNIRLKDDAIRRVVPCRLDSPLERPEERDDFRIDKDCPCGCRGDLLAHSKRARGRLVCACLTIVRGYIAAGRPDQGLKPMDFAAWSGLVRNAVHWATGYDPCGGRQALIADDEETGDMRALLRGWKELCRLAVKPALTAGAGASELEMRKDDLPEVYATVAGWSRDGRPSARAIGNRLKSIRRRIIDGQFVDFMTSHGNREWFVRDFSTAGGRP